MASSNHIPNTSNISTERLATSEPSATTEPLKIIPDIVLQTAGLTVRVQSSEQPPSTHTPNEEFSNLTRISSEFDVVNPNSKVKENDDENRTDTDKNNKTKKKKKKKTTTTSNVDETKARPPMNETKAAPPPSTKDNIDDADLIVTAVHPMKTPFLVVTIFGKAAARAHVKSILLLQTFPEEGKKVVISKTKVVMKKDPGQSGGITCIPFDYCEINPQFESTSFFVQLLDHANKRLRIVEGYVVEGDKPNAIDFHGCHTNGIHVQIIPYIPSRLESTFKKIRDEVERMMKSGQGKW